MRPRLEFVDADLRARILSEAYQLLESPGAKVGAPEVRDLLAASGASITGDVAHIPSRLVDEALRSVPREFFLYSRAGSASVHYGGNHVHFDPGSSCLNILDPVSHVARPALASDLVRLIQVTEMLPEFAAQSTALVCNDVPSEIGDWYRLLLVLLHSDKPIVTGAFRVPTLHTMFELLACDAGGHESLRKRPRAIFDVCPSPPLNWSEFASRNLVELARAGVPAEIVSMPLAGATAPVTLAGAVVQHAAECLSGIVIHQLANPGSPIVWGGAPAIFDMSTGNTPMGAIETAMLNLACAQVGKSLGLPTHGYLVASDASVVDVQAGQESATSAVLGALAGINMISGAGMLDFLACHSIEKLVIDAESIASAQRLLRGILVPTDTLALGMFAQTGLSGEFLKLKETRSLFRTEQHFPSSIVDRGGDPNAADILTRAQQRAEELIAGYRRPDISPDVEQQLYRLAKEKAGLDSLPGLERQPATPVSR